MLCGGRRGCDSWPEITRGRTEDNREHCKGGRKEGVVEYKHKEMKKIQGEKQEERK
jgi:hypothetical protein